MTITLGGYRAGSIRESIYITWVPGSHYVLKRSGNGHLFVSGSKDIDCIKGALSRILNDDCVVET